MGGNRNEWFESGRVQVDKMSEHTDSCFMCTFQECDSCDCVIPGKSGYESEEDRNFDDNGYDGWKPCKYYLAWDNAIYILTKHVENKAAALRKPEEK